MQWDYGDGPRSTRCAGSRCATRRSSLSGVTTGLTVASCVAADPQSKGGSEATVSVAKADIVPTDHNLRAAYADFSEFEREREAFCERVNTREHRSVKAGRKATPFRRLKSPPPPSGAEQTQRATGEAGPQS